MTGSENSKARMLAGECLCRAVRYKVADAFEYALNCHCSNCRRTTGSAFKPFAGIVRDKLGIAAAKKRGIPVVSYAATKVKKLVTGSGRAGKEQMQHAIARAS